MLSGKSKESGLTILWAAEEETTMERLLPSRKQPKGELPSNQSNKKYKMKSRCKMQNALPSWNSERMHLLSLCFLNMHLFSCASTAKGSPKDNGKEKRWLSLSFPYEEREKREKGKTEKYQTSKWEGWRGQGGGSVYFCECQSMTSWRRKKQPRSFSARYTDTSRNTSIKIHW